MPLIFPDPLDSPNGIFLTPPFLPAMTNAELQDAVESQILANETAYKALAESQESLHGSSVLVLMPTEHTPRFITEDELTSVRDASSAAESALTLLGSVASGEHVVIAQGPNFQMVAFTYTWSV